METEKENRPNVQENQSIFFRALGTTYKVLSESVAGSAAIVEDALKPKSWCTDAQHTYEDEISFCVGGELSVI